VSAATAPPDLATPWQRYWARSLDVIVSFMLTALLVAMASPWDLMVDGGVGGRIGSWMIEWLLLPFAFLLDALFYAVFGNTPGKWLAGLRVLAADGGRVSRSAYLRRNFGVYWYGLGTGLPVISLVTLARGYRAVSAFELPRWDARDDTRCVAPFARPYRVWLVAAPVVATKAFGFVMYALDAGR
jgi:uncharacterized RDD family membrane protein YckC